MRRRTQPWEIALCGGIVLFFAYILWPVNPWHRGGGEQARCLFSKRQIATAMLVYGADYNDTLPLSSKWMRVLSTFVQSESVYKCPKVSDGEFGTAYFLPVAGRKWVSIKEPASTPLVFESSLLGDSAVSGLSTFPSPTRHKMDPIAFVDGHAKSYTTPGARALPMQ